MAFLGIRFEFSVD